MVTTVGKQRQITLPAEACAALGIEPGDTVEVLRYRDQLNVVKKTPGAAAGILKGTKVKKQISERDSLMSNFE